MKFIGMRGLVMVLSGFLMFSCIKHKEMRPFKTVEVKTIYSDSLSIRAIEIMDGSLAFAADKGTYGLVNLKDYSVKTGIQRHDSILPEFRAVAHTATDFFKLSVANPALLYKTGDRGAMELVYKEEDPNVFYDAMLFINDKEGIAVGDSMHGCLSMLRTSDGGNSWHKIPCSNLPKGEEGEGAFAASNTNITTKGNSVWIGTTHGRVYSSKDKGRTWTVTETPIAHTKDTQGIYSIDFYDEEIGVLMGGDYTEPDVKLANKAITSDGGKTWSLIANGNEPGYKSCVQFVPNSGGKGMVAVGFTGISYSSDGGQVWTELSQEPFYTIRFSNDSLAFAAGKHRLATLRFR